MAIDVSKQIAKAEKAFAGRKYDMSIEIFLQALQIDPNNRAGRRGVRLAALIALVCLPLYLAGRPSLMALALPLPVLALMAEFRRSAAGGAAS